MDTPDAGAMDARASDLATGAVRDLRQALRGFSAGRLAEANRHPGAAK